MSCILSAAITCGHPGNPTNGLTQGTQFNLNDVAKFTCNIGYHLEGTSKSQCLANGQWTKPLPICRSKLCFSTPLLLPTPPLLFLRSKSVLQPAAASLQMEPLSAYPDCASFQRIPADSSRQKGSAALHSSASVSCGKCR